VYEAWDRRERTLIAVKVLERTHAEAVLAFKREFRELVDMRHPNLVALRELLFEEGQWLLCMELVQHACDVVTFTRKQTSSDVIGHFDEARVRYVFSQTVEALRTLHAAGKVHRDIKPSNIRVTPEGRAVLIDFGLISQAGVSDSNIAGTLLYMAPEQSLGDPLSSAADYFGLGMVLYEALTGSTPFLGSSIDIMMQKQKGPAQAPHSIDSTIPEALSTLCMQWLDPRAEARPTGEQALRVLRDEQSAEMLRQSYTPLPLGVSAQAPAFVGRGHELSRLAEAFARAKAGSLSTIVVSGESGVGKTRLVRTFMDRLRVSEERALVLQSRCYENETLSYKALDGIIDALGRELRRLPDDTCRALLPRRAGLLPLIFPILDRVPALLELSENASGASDPVSLRNLVFGALRELLVRLSDYRPLVLFIDDLQWADAESMDVLAELLRPPNAPGLLLIIASRPADSCTTVVQRGVALIREADERSQTVDVACLPHDRAIDLALSLMGESNEAWAELIAREAEGHPLFVELLVRHSEDVGEALTLERAILERMRRIDESARRLLELCCVAGVPLARSTLQELCDTDEAFVAQLAVLHVARLVRTSRIANSEHIEPFHDRIRTTVTSSLSVDRTRALHRRIALALESQPNADRERVATHWHKAGAFERAARFAVLAGDQAHEALAFRKAGRMYRWALENAPELRGRRELSIKLAEALANAGSSSEAADLFLEASKDASAGEAIELRRRAAELFYQTGRLEAGHAVADELLKSLGLSLPRTKAQALRRMGWVALKRKLRSTRFEPRPRSAISHEELVRVDVLWSVASTLSPLEHFTGAALQCEHYQYALSAGEPSRAAQALAMDAFGKIFMGRRSGIIEAFAQPRELARAAGRPDVRALVDYLDGCARGMLGEWDDSMALLDTAERVFVEECTGVAWLLGTTRTTQLAALFNLGLWQELAQRYPRTVLYAEERGDPYLRAQTLLTCAFAYHLMHDRIDRAKTALAEALSSEARVGIAVFQHWHADLSIGVYGGDEDAYARALRDYGKLKSSGCMRMPGVELNARLRHGLVALAQVRSRTSDPLALLRVAEGEAARLAHGAAHESSHVASSELLWAAILDTRGKPAQAIDHFEVAEVIARKKRRHLLADVARVRRGQLQGGEVGQQLVTEVSLRLQREGVRKPLAFLDAMLPGILQR
jgi:serine/threonine protein kinase